MATPSMNLVNASVTLLSPSKTLLPWTIMQVTETEHSIKDFFSNNVTSRLSNNYNLETAQVGRDKFILDNVDISLPIVAVVLSFGPYLKYIVSGIPNCCIALSDTETAEPDRSGYCPLSTLLHPVTEKNRKDKLYNDLLHFLESFSVSLEESEQEEGKKLLIVLQNIIWHIDGHQHVFKERALAIPSFFCSFADYNMPQLSKHRKRLTSNLSCDVLRDLALDLSTVLNFNFWERELWAHLKPHFNNLLYSVSSYVDYLVKKNKKVKESHRSPTPIREVSQNLHLKYIFSSDEFVNSPLLKSIEDGICDMPFYNFIPITNLLPSDYSQKHRAVDLLISSGLSFPTILLVYAPGSNVGNAHFLWRVPPDADSAECFEQSQACIEEIKKQLPTFHSRAMRSALYQKFGRVSPHVKPSALHYFYKELTGIL